VDVKNSEQSGKSRPQARDAYLERLGDGGRARSADPIVVEAEVLQRLVDLPRHAQHARNEWFRGWLPGWNGKQTAAQESVYDQSTHARLPIKQRAANHTNLERSGNLDHTTIPKILAGKVECLCCIWNKF